MLLSVSHSQHRARTSSRRRPTSTALPAGRLFLTLSHTHTVKRAPDYIPVLCSVDHLIQAMGMTEDLLFFSVSQPVIKHLFRGFFAGGQAPGQALRLHQ